MEEMKDVKVDIKIDKSEKINSNRNQAKETRAWKMLG